MMTHCCFYACCLKLKLDNALICNDTLADSDAVLGCGMADLLEHHLSCDITHCRCCLGNSINCQLSLYEPIISSL